MASDRRQQARNISIVLACDLFVILVLISHYPFRVECAMSAVASYAFNYICLIYKYGLFAKPDERFFTTIAEIETTDGVKETVTIVPISSTPATKRPPLARWRTMFDENVPTYPDLGERGQLLLKDVTLYLVRKFELEHGRKVRYLELFVIERKSPPPGAPSAEYQERKRSIYRMSLPV